MNRRVLPCEVCGRITLHFIDGENVACSQHTTRLAEADL